MSMVATDIKGLLTISVKSRHDSYTDQYNRIFMIKLFLVTTVIMGISWYNDSITCIVPESHEVSDGFVSQACWIQGVYIYKELSNRSDQAAYFGIPKDMDLDGILPNGDLCHTNPKFSFQKKSDCVEMKKTFFLQYQWMPFLIASFSILYYIPYLFYRTINNDMVLLKKAIKEDEPDAEKIAMFHFNLKKPRGLDCLRVFFNIIIKLLYIIANLVTFFSLNFLLNENYYYYGVEWVKWTRLDNTVAYDYMGMRDEPKPGNYLLPPFGYCEMYESARDVKVTLGNKHKFVCELSQNILYQYSLAVLWFAILAGIIISVLGFLVLILHYLFGICIKTRVQLRKRLYGVHLTFRELEYLDFIKSKNQILYGEVLTRLRTAQQ